MEEEIRTDKIPLTDESKNKFVKITSDLIQNLTLELREISKTDRFIEILDNQISQPILLNFRSIIFEDSNIAKLLDLTNIKNLLKYRMIIGILNLDFSVAVRLYLNSSYQYESIVASRQLYIIANEGYKRIYGFNNHRKASMWIAGVGKIIDDDFPDLKLEYDLMTKKLNAYESTLNQFKYIRDFSIHYDKEPMKVYDMMMELDINKAFREINPFLSTIVEMYHFVTKLFERYIVENRLQNINMIDNFDMIEKQIKDCIVKFNDQLVLKSLSKSQEAITDLKLIAIDLLNLQSNSI